MFNNTVDGILKKFNETIAALEKLASRKMQEASDLSVKIEDLEADRVDCQTEELRARDVANKLRSIVA